jgi:hypothetical protein
MVITFECSCSRFRRKGECAAAFAFAAHSHKVNFFDFPEFKDNIAAASKSGGIAPLKETSKDTRK